LTITIADARGCSVDTTINLINEDNNFELTIDATPPDCASGLDNGTISFPGFDSVDGTCEWSDPSLNAQNCTLIGLASGFYNVTVTDPSGCQKDTFIDLRVLEELEIEVSDIIDATCYELSNGQAVATVTNNPLGAASFNFFWSNPADDGMGIFDDATQLAAGDNFVYAFDGLCTSDTIKFNIDQPEFIELDRTSSQIDMANCFGACDGTVVLEANGGTSANGTYAFLWEDGTNSNTRSDLCEGTYYISITDDNNCEFIDSVIITQPDILIASVDTSKVVSISCGNDNTGSLTINTTGGCGNNSYQWTDNVSTSATAVNLGIGTYQVTVTDACGCTSVTEFTFTGSVPIVAEAITPEVPLCAGDQSSIGIASVSGGTGSNYTYSINFGERLPIDSFVMVDPGMYTLVVFDSAGCSADITGVEVESPNNFDVNLGPDIVLDLGDNQAILTPTITGGNPDYAFEWFSETAFSCMQIDCESIEIVPTGFTTFEVLVTDQNGCTAKDDINIEIKAQRNVYLPNTFTPDALPPNNKFMVLTGQGVVELVSLRIFDRWGNLMYERTNLPAPTIIDDGWDGRRGSGGNNKVEQGVYVFVAQVRFVDDKILNYKGEVTLIR
jgi:hypothetical protein